MKPVTLAVVIALVAWFHLYLQPSATASAGTPAPSLRAPVSWTVGDAGTAFRSGDRAGIGDRDPADRTRRRG